MTTTSSEAETETARLEEEEEKTNEDTDQPLLSPSKHSPAQWPAATPPHHLEDPAALPLLSSSSTFPPASFPFSFTTAFHVSLRVLLLLLLLLLVLHLASPYLSPAYRPRLSSIPFLPSSPLSSSPSLPDLPSHPPLSSLDAIQPALWSTPLVYPHPPLPAACIASWDGRFGNHIYQLMFLLSAAARHRLAVYVPIWAAYPQMFLDAMYRQDCPEPRDDGSVVRVLLPREQEWGAWFDRHPLEDREGKEVTPAHAWANASRQGVAMYQGYFQWHHAGYRPYERLLRASVRLNPPLEQTLQAMWYEVLYAVPDDTLLVGVHLRRGDYSNNHNCVFCRIPTWWYFDWIRRLRADGRAAQHALQQQQMYEEAAMQALGFTADTRPPPRNPLCQHNTSLPTVTGVRLCFLLTSDEIDSTLVEFIGHNEAVTTRKEAQAALGREVLLDMHELPDFLVDWWLLTRTAMVGVSHSTFSYTAVLFNVNEGAGSYWRPDPETKTVEEFRPWEVDFNHEAFANLPQLGLTAPLGT